MFFLLFGFWIILNGKWTTEIAIVGAVISALLYVFLCKFMDYSPKKEWACIRRLPKAVCYAAYLLKEVFLSSWGTIKLIWSPKEIVQPVVTSFRSKLRTDAGKVILANSITLTPGTLTVDIHKDVFLVHALDETMVDGIEGSEMEQRIMNVEGGRTHD